MISILPQILLAVICGSIAYQSALLTLSVYPEPESSHNWTPTAERKINETNRLSTQKLQDQAIFGRYQGERIAYQQEQIDAPKTRLKLTLVGIVAATDPRLSSVIIEYKRSQDSYFIESEIPGTDAIVTEIYHDRIIISVNGEEQTLILDGLEEEEERLAKLEKGEEVKEKKSTNTSKRSSRSSKRKEIPLDRDELVEDPGKLLDYVRISPVREGDQIKGYRVNPGKNPELFEEAGLKAGDLAVELNGVDLTDITQAVSLMKEFPTMTEMSLTIDRDGELNELYFSIP
ncbi:type II secretion system protein GspC [Psychromonas sp. 14N.309.X.WAT.B.A12]|jgi:general secretion pathway protein C|uniref:type II secretion system protein GspC n=1 Tax=unclassified Psychromonas TaxID=2614957 RepID=UPI0025B10BDC|nr:type II secretion system protein GspC [Psychromonas sp. 14N.309.X.WAT.B.A12]MDN2664461.1 type II secretion system protein GspC [Psychromonas sp. 14N.309.X.WAT.B.A12]